MPRSVATRMGSSSAYTGRRCFGSAERPAGHLALILNSALASPASESGGADARLRDRTSGGLADSELGAISTETMCELAPHSESRSGLGLESRPLGTSNANPLVALRHRERSLAGSREVPRCLERVSQSVSRRPNRALRRRVAKEPLSRRRNPRKTEGLRDLADFEAIGRRNAPRMRLATDELRIARGSATLGVCWRKATVPCCVEDEPMAGTSRNAGAPTAISDQ